MKTTRHINVRILTVLAAVLTLSHLSFAAPWNEKNAFCLDRYNSAFSQYLNTKHYNECMEQDLDILIKQQEEATDRQFKAIRDFHAEEGKQMARKREKVWAKREADKQAAELKRQQELNKTDDLFNQFE